MYHYKNKKNSNAKKSYKPIDILGKWVYPYGQRKRAGEKGRAHKPRQKPAAPARRTGNSDKKERTAMDWNVIAQYLPQYEKAAWLTLRLGVIGILWSIGIGLVCAVLSNTIKYRCFGGS